MMQSLNSLNWTHSYVVNIVIESGEPSYSGSVFKHEILLLLLSFQRAYDMLGVRLESIRNGK